MGENKGFSNEIQYTKAADKFFRKHENVREEYEDAIRELLIGHPPQLPETKEGNCYDKDNEEDAGVPAGRNHRSGCCLCNRDGHRAGGVCDRTERVRNRSGSL